MVTLVGQSVNFEQDLFPKIPHLSSPCTDMQTDGHFAEVLLGSALDFGLLLDAAAVEQY